MDVFFLGFRQKGLLTTRNANAQGCYFSKWRTSQRGKEKNQSGLGTGHYLVGGGGGGEATIFGGRVTIFLASLWGGLQFF